MLHAANEGAASRFEQARAVFEGVGADPERVRPVGTDAIRGPRRGPPYSALSGRQSDRGGPDAAAAVARGAGRGARLTARYPRRREYRLVARVSDELVVVTVTYSPGPHLDRFLATLSHATERPVTVIMADNGSTDGAPEEALERYPNTRLLRTGGNLGYGTAVNRAVAEYRKDAAMLGLLHRRQPRRAVGTAAASTCCSRRPPAGRGPASLGPLIRDPDGSVYPSARHLPSLIRGGMHAVVGPLWRSNPWTAAYRQERLEPSERPVGWLSGSCLLLRARRVR